MKYFSIETVVNAYKGFQDCMTNKSWGYLAILKGCKSSICPSVPFEVDMDMVSNFLENIFNLSQTKKRYESGRTLYVVFSNKWDHYFNYQGKYSPNLFDIIVWAYRRKAFNDDITKEKLFQLFSDEFNIPIGVISGCFNIEPKEILFDNTLYSESDLKTKLNQIGVNVLSNNIDAKKASVVASPGEISRGPFVQTLYAGLDITDYVLILQSDYYSLYGKKKDISYNDNEKTKILQQIFYGAPGTGKSFKIKRDTKNQSKIRTTFHPDSDYSTFVGCYKPTMNEDVKYDKEGNEKSCTKQIEYAFVAQAFLKAYVKAWKFYCSAEDGTAKAQYLIIEEINRGNCAQIFGDLFQLLDRNEDGYSTYPIVADTDIQRYLSKEFEKVNIPDSLNAIYDDYDGNIVEDIKNGIVLALPNNLYIWATMNTSDQSLFPIDSAFKRRWDWKYMPIDTKKENWNIEVDGKKYSWSDFLEAVNEQIFEVTKSEDKKLGFYFCRANNHVVDAEKFVSKVIFYLYNDVFKDYGYDRKMFQGEDGKTIQFHEYFQSNGDINEQKAALFLNNLEIKPIGENNVE